MRNSIHKIVFMSFLVVSFLAWLPCECYASGGLMGAIDKISKEIDGDKSADSDKATEAQPTAPPTQETLPPIGEGTPSASSYDPETGITTKSQGNPDGSRTVTKTDKGGNVISKKTLPPRGRGTPSASSYDPDTGITTKSQGNPDGSRTVTQTDKKGKVISSETVGPRTRQEQQGQPETFPDAEDFKEVVGEEWAEELAEEETQPGEAPEIVERRIRELNAEIDRLNIELSSRKKLHARIQTKPDIKLNPDGWYATKNSRVFHRGDCHLLEKSNDLMTFLSYQKAVQAGGIPCDVCSRGFK